MRPRISIFLPRDTQFYASLLGQLMRGFENAGADCSGALSLLDASQLRDWISLHRPHAVFEMNRSGHEIQELPPGVRHIAWIVDLRGQPAEYYRDSDITYFLMYVDPRPDIPGLRKVLLPGACPFDYPDVNCQPQRQLAFVGHIPKPWTRAELERDLTGGLGRLTFGDLIETLTQVLDQRKTLDAHGQFPALEEPSLLEQANTLCLRHAGMPLVADARLRYDIEGRLVRHANRCEVGDLMVRSGLRGNIFGPENWLDWPRYAPLYAGWLDSPGALHDAYGTSELNIHEGVGMHFRSLDIMASGGLLFYRRSQHDAMPGGIEEYFRDGEHYVGFVPEDFCARAQQLTSDCGLATEIRRSAAAKIAQEHTWAHRAREVLADLRDIE